MRLMVSGTTKTVRRLAATHADRLGMLLTPNNRNSVDSVVSIGLPWCIDNGAYSGFDEERFLRLVLRAAGQPGLLWIVAPDVVADAAATLGRWSIWRERLAGMPLAFVGQDGQEERQLPDDAQAFFIGGSTAWKLSRAAADLAMEAKRRGWWVHMGRVNSRKRIHYAISAGCDSIDGSSASMFGDKYIHKYCRWIRQRESERLLF